MKPTPKQSPVLDEVALKRQIETLRQDVRRLKLERELLKRAHEILKQGSDIVNRTGFRGGSTPERIES